MTPSSVTIANDTDIACDLDAIGSLVGHLFAELRLHPDAELGITLVGEERMSELHVEWMDEPGPTDVLSFPIDELRSAEPGTEPEPGVLGDIVLCPAFATAQASERGRSLDGELQFLVTHGVLHLIGYDHATDDEYAQMFALQDALLDGWRR